MIGRREQRGSGISVLGARHDDDDYLINIFFCKVCKLVLGYVSLQKFIQAKTL